jgi:hypothetical protein
MNRQKRSRTTSNPGERSGGPPGGPSDMAKKDIIQNEIEATLRCFDTDGRLEVDPGFYADLRRRIRAEAADAPSAPTVLFGKRMLIPALLILMVVLNIFTALAVTRARKSEITTREKGLTALVHSYAADQAGFASYLK